MSVPWPGEEGGLLVELSSLLVFAAAGTLPETHDPSLASSCGTSASMRLSEFMSTAS